MILSEMDANPSQPRRQNKGVIIPQYMGTFADLMTLLLCFFVMLLTMAEVDVLKYKVVVRSMENAFGVERPEPLEPKAKATSVIQQEFSPNPDEAALQQQIRQAETSQNQKLNAEDIAKIKAAKLEKLHEQLKKTFAAAMDAQLISMDSLADRVLIRINEQASFPSGDATLKPGFAPLMRQLALALTDIDALFVVAGHTDNIPLNTGLYRSNWELSAARAASVVHALLAESDLQENQFRIEAYADTQPLTSNATATGRAQNRRVEIGIINP